MPARSSERQITATLTALGVDTIILIGCSTSGCVRASAVDGMQYGFRVIVPRECVGDRAPGPHEANLFDIDAKYGDVMSLEEVLEYLQGVE
jgi:maleamate amidohydrolase